MLIPSEKVIEMKDGKKKSKMKKFFPGYILVEAVLDKETKHLILNAPGVIGFVGPQGRIRLRSSPTRCGGCIGRMEERKDVELMEIPFHIGEAVKVVDGPFNNFTGFVQDMNEEKMKVKVMVSIFGRKTPVELDFSQVEIEK